MPVKFEIDGKQKGFVTGTIDFGLHIAISLLDKDEKKVMADKKVENILLPLRDGLMICRKI